MGFFKDLFPSSSPSFERLLNSYLLTYYPISFTRVFKKKGGSKEEKQSRESSRVCYIQRSAVRLFLKFT